MPWAEIVKADPCECRACKMAQHGFYRHAWGTQEEQVDRVVEQFVNEEPKWATKTWTWTVDWLERELDEIFGVTHARWLTRVERALAEESYAAAAAGAGLRLRM